MDQKMINVICNGISYLFKDYLFREVEPNKHNKQPLEEKIRERLKNYGTHYSLNSFLLKRKGDDVIKSYLSFYPNLRRKRPCKILLKIKRGSIFSSVNGKIIDENGYLFKYSGKIY